MGSHLTLLLNSAQPEPFEVSRLRSVFSQLAEHVEVHSTKHSLLETSVSGRLLRASLDAVAVTVDGLHDASLEVGLRFQRLYGGSVFAMFGDDASRFLDLATAQCIQDVRRFEEAT